VSEVRCGRCGGLGWRDLTPSGYEKPRHRNLRIDRDHDFVLPAGTEEEQDREAASFGSKSHPIPGHVHRGQFPDCPDCQNVAKVSILQDLPR
jgi:hypothetical protein